MQFIIKFIYLKLFLQSHQVMTIQVLIFLSFRKIKNNLCPIRKPHFSSIMLKFAPSIAQKRETKFILQFLRGILFGIYETHLKEPFLLDFSVWNQLNFR